MKHYLFVESQSAFEAADTPQFFTLAHDLAAQGNKVEVLLVQNGVMAARAGAKAESVTATLKAGIAVMADEFAMKERAVTRAALVRGVNPTAIQAVIDRMADGWNVIWH